jgi:hypothetical protein
MAGSDIVLCQLKYTGNSAVDKFLCIDRKASGRGLPAEDSIDNVDDIDTDVTITTVDSKKKGTLVATFDRLLDTLDSVNDERLKQSSTIDAIWAHG